MIEASANKEILEHELPKVEEEETKQVQNLENQ